MNYKRLSDEEKNDYIWRVCSNKNDKLYDITWEEVGEILNSELGKTYTSSKWRKNYQVMKKGYDRAIVKNADVTEEIFDIDVKKNELYKQQVKTRDALREYRKHLRDEARVETIRDAFKESHSNATEITFEKYKQKHDGKKEAILMLSDFHVGIEIENYWNTYNKEVFEERITSIVNKVIKYSISMNIGTLYVASLGDLISGAIHITTRIAEEMDVLDQAMYVSKVMKNLLSELSDFGLNIKYLSVVGNHDRLNKNFKEHIEKESFNKLVDWYIYDKVEDGVLNIEFIVNEIDDGIGHFEVNGQHCLIVHGHQDGIGSVLQNLITATGIIPKYILMGHFHNKNSLTQGTSRVFVNGSLVGVDEYAKSKRFFSEPSQTLLIFDEEDVIDVELKL